MDINATAKHGRTALWLAAEQGSTEIVKHLLTVEMIDVNLQDEYGITALAVASDKGHAEIVRLLL